MVVAWRAATIVLVLLATSASGGTLQDPEITDEEGDVGPDFFGDGKLDLLRVWWEEAAFDDGPVAWNITFQVRELQDFRPPLTYRAYGWMNEFAFNGHTYSVGVHSTLDAESDVEMVATLCRGDYPQNGVWSRPLPVDECTYLATEPSFRIGSPGTVSVQVTRDHLDLGDEWRSVRLYLHNATTFGIKNDQSAPIADQSETGRDVILRGLGANPPFVSQEPPIQPPIKHNTYTNTTSETVHNNTVRIAPPPWYMDPGWWVAISIAILGILVGVGSNVRKPRT